MSSIKNWLEDDKPREKMMQKGASALTDAELLTILIAVGTRERSALDLAKDTLALAHNNLRELGRLDIKELQKINGIGPAKAITIAAALELGRRRQVADALERPSIKSPIDAVEILMPLLQDLTYESFYVVYLTRAMKIIKTEQLSNGGMAGTVVDVRIILKNALLYNSTHLIIAHNHPAGTTKPSQDDIQLTKKLVEAAKLMDIRVLDHLIIAGNKFTSMEGEGYF